MNDKNSKGNQQDSTNQSESNQPETASNGEIIPSSDAPRTNKGNRQTKSKEEIAKPTRVYWGLKWSEWLTLAFTGVIAGSAVVYTIFAILQWRIMGEQAEVMKASLEIGQRAYVFPKYIRMKEFRAGEKLLVEVELENSGNTPALNLSGSIHYRARETALPENPDYGKPADGFTSVSVLPPSVPSLRLVSSRGELLDRHIVSVGRGELSIYVYGILQYEDVFRQRRKTKFCGLYDAPTGLFKACEHHNSMD